MSLSTTLARQWIDRWDRQQEGYLPDREDVFATIADAVEIVAGRPDPVVIDLGCGPGSLSGRLLERLPEAHVIGVDADPLLLKLAEANYRLPLVDHDLRDPAWVLALTLPRPADAVVSTTALHWLRIGELAEVYAQAARLLRPGGILLNGDEMRTASPGMASLHEALNRRQIERADVADREEWGAWWNAIADDADLSELVAARRARAVEHPHDLTLSYDVHVRLLRDAGFGEVDSIRQYGGHRIVAAIR
jgi:SAM-dependent methyltransferase